MDSLKPFGQAAGGGYPSAGCTMRHEHDENPNTARDEYVDDMLAKSTDEDLCAALGAKPEQSILSALLNDGHTQEAVEELMTAYWRQVWEDN